MSYALSRPASSIQRSSLLLIVVTLHATLFLLAMAAKTVVPQVMEIPLIVDLLPAPTAAAPPQAKPLPVVQPRPVKPRPAPPKPAPAPVLEPTLSSEPAPDTPLTAPPETEPAPPAPAAPVAAPALSQARFDADYLRNPAPSYPALSRRMGEEGQVLLRVSVNPQGTADTVEIRTSSGSSRLDEAARRTVRNWRFVPAKRGDVAVQSWVLVPIIFTLEQ